MCCYRHHSLLDFMHGKQRTVSRARSRQHRHTASPRGSVLLYALMILSVMALVGIVVASLTVRETHIARSFDDALVAYYAAESGAERSLDIVSEHRRSPQDFICPATGAPMDLDCTMDIVRDFAPEVTPVSLSGSEGEWFVDAVETSDTQQSVTLPIMEQGNTQIDLYDPDDPFTFMSAESLHLLWKNPQCAVPTRVEVSFVEFSATQFGITDDLAYTQVFTCNSLLVPSGSEYDCGAVSNYPAANKNYVVRLRALDCTIYDGQSTFFDADDGFGGGGSVEPIPSAVRIVSVGEGAGSQRRMSVTTRWRAGASGLVDFVLFAIERVEK